MLLAMDCAPPAELFRLLYSFDDLLWGESRAVGDEISDTLSKGRICTFFCRMFTKQTLCLMQKLTENLCVLAAVVSTSYQFCPLPSYLLSDQSLCSVKVKSNANSGSKIIINLSNDND